MMYVVYALALVGAAVIVMIGCAVVWDRFHPIEQQDWSLTPDDPADVDKEDL